MKIENFSPLLEELPKQTPSQKSNPQFSNLLEDFIQNVNNDLHASTKAQERLMEGKTQNMVELMSTIEKADISLRLATEIRNKALEAYQEIMRMQV